MTETTITRGISQETNAEENTMTGIESTKPRIEFDWTKPAYEKPARPDFGVHVPDLPFEVAMPETEPGHSEMMQEVSATMMLGRDDVLMWLTSPDLGPERGFLRPDLYPAAVIARRCLEAIKQELRHGPRRTYLGADGAWHVEEESEETKAVRRRAELKG